MPPSHKSHPVTYRLAGEPFHVGVAEVVVHLNRLSADTILTGDTLHPHLGGLQPTLYDSLSDSLGRDPKELCYFRHREHSFVGHAVQPLLLSPRCPILRQVILQTAYANTAKQHKQDNLQRCRRRGAAGWQVWSTFAGMSLVKRSTRHEPLKRYAHSVSSVSSSFSFGTV